MPSPTTYVITLEQTLNHLKTSFSFTQKRDQGFVFSKKSYYKSTQNHIVVLSDLFKTAFAIEVITLSWKLYFGITSSMIDYSLQDYGFSTNQGSPAHSGLSTGVIAAIVVVSALVPVGKLLLLCLTLIAYFHFQYCHTPFSNIAVPPFPSISPSSVPPCLPMCKKCFGKGMNTELPLCQDSSVPLLDVEIMEIK